MDWSVKDNMVKGMFFCATLTNRRGDLSYLYKQERKRPTPMRRRSSRTQAVLEMVIQGRWMPVSGKKVGNMLVFSNHSTFHR